MDRKKLVLLLGALVVAIGSAFLARSMFAGEATPVAVAQEEPQGPKVLVANRALPAGTIITADAMGYQQWPEELVQDAYFIEGNSDMSQLLGTVVRFPVTAGEPVTQGSLVRPGDRGFLAAALGPGMRAVTVPVSAKTGVAGFVFPGDRVDMVLTQSVAGDGRALEAAETVLRNLRVLATDQTTEQVTDQEGKTIVRAFRTVTLEVTPENCRESCCRSDKLANSLWCCVPSRTIRLNLSVRLLLARSKSRLMRRLKKKSASCALPWARPVEGKSTFQTGGDVSRFQRKTIPPQNDGGRNRAAARTPAAPGVPAKIAGAPVYKGPSVRVTRGKATTEVPVSGSITAATGNLNGRVGRGVGQAGQTVPSALSTIR